MYIPEADHQRTDVAQLQVTELMQETDTSSRYFSALSTTVVLLCHEGHHPQSARVVVVQASVPASPVAVEGLIALHLEPANVTQSP